MTKPEFYLAPDGSLQPLPESGPLTLTDGALTYPGREEADPSDPLPETPEDPRPWAHATLLKLLDPDKMGVASADYDMVAGDVLLVDDVETARYTAANGADPWGGGWTGQRVRSLRSGQWAWAHVDCVEVIAAPTIADRKSWPQMAVGDRLTGAAASRLSINPLIGMANRTFAPMRWRGYTEGGSFVVERVA